MTIKNNTIEVTNLNYSLDGQTIIKNLSFSLQQGDRCLLVGANGAGKTTLLKLLAGKNLCDNILVLGKHSYRDTSLNFRRAFIHQNWGLRTIPFAGNHIPYVADIKVKDMMQDLQNQYPDRKKELVKLLDINEEWRMHLISDGQRRRVQIFLGLLRPVEIILLDEITNVLDILCRDKLLTWLKNEAITNKTTIIYATHIFDGLDDWYNNILYLKKNNSDTSLGSFISSFTIDETVYDVIKKWLLLEAEEESKEITGNLDRTLSKSTNSAGGFAPGRFYNYW